MPTLVRDKRGSRRAAGDDDAVEVDDTGRRRIDPRIKARREAVQEGHRQRRFRRLFLALLLVTLAIGAYLVVRSPLLSVQTVDVVAGPHTSADQIRQAAALRPDDRLLELDLAAVEQRVEALPWVDHATVERQWPRTVKIAVTERTMRALVPDGNGGWLMVDGTGRVLGPSPAISNVFTPHIEGLTPVAPGQNMDPKIQGALRVASTLTPSLGGRIATLKVTPEETIDLKLLPRGTAWLGRADDDLTAKMRALQTMLAQVDLRDLCRLDLRVPSSPVLTRDPQCA